jgi:hypothetical protein
MTTYRFNGTITGRMKRAGAQRIGEALEAIRVAHAGSLHPQAVVQDAGDPQSVLHPYFEWNDAKAAYLHRVDQARALIRSIRVIDDGDQKSRPAFLSIRSDAGVAYRSIDDVISSADLRARLLVQAQRDLDAWTARYQELSEIVALVAPAREELRRRVGRPRAGGEARPT